MSEIYWPGVVSIGLMYLLIFFVGLWASKKHGEGEASVEDLMLAGRSLPLGIGLLSMTATWVGGGYINGTAETTFTTGLLWGIQAPLGYSLSLILGGVFFARIMRENGYATLIDPLEIRFGRELAAIFTAVAVLSELIWSAAILVALGSSFATVIGLDFQTSLLISAAVAVGYTITGGMWSVAWTDAVQLFLIVIGLTLAIPFAWDTAGGMEPIRAASGTFGFKSVHEGVSYADLMMLLVLGGIPWNVYFQRVLATPNAKVAERLSIGAGILCVFMAIPALLLGLAARATFGGGELGVDPANLAAAPGEVTKLLTELKTNTSMVLPIQLRLAVPGLVGIAGLGAVAAAVMSSADSSILSATSMGAWNGYRRLIRPEASPREMVWLMRILIVAVGGIATLIALNSHSVTALWYLCGDVVYVLLFPALVLAIFDPKANRIGMAGGLAVSTVLRLGGGEPSLGVPAFLHYPVWTQDGVGMVAFPFRTLAMVAGLLTVIVLSRLTGSVDPPRPLTRAPAPG